MDRHEGDRTRILAVRKDSGRCPYWWPEREAGVVLARLGDSVPKEVWLGYHLCYGEYRARHRKDPDDLGNLVEIANRVSALLSRSVQWFPSCWDLHARACLPV